MRTSASLALVFALAATRAWGADADLFVPLARAEAARLAPPADAEPGAAPKAAKRWLVRIDRQRLFETIRAVERSGSGASTPGASVSERLLLNVAEGFEFEVVVERAERTLSGHSLSGRVAGVPGSAVTFAVHADMVLGTVWTPLSVYELAHLKDGVHVFRKVDPSAGPPLGEPVIKGEGGWGESPPAETDEAAADSVVDVLVVWTPKAEENAGDEAEMRAAIDLAVAWTNDAYERSGAEVRINLVGAEQVDYVEQTDSAGMPRSESDLYYLEGARDGFMDGVHARRDALGADLVSLITGTGNVGGIAGIGLSFSLSVFFPETTVTRLSLVFAHELGHNMGLYHDRYQELGPAGRRSGAFRFGYVNKRAFEPDAEEDCWLTIMSYHSRCRDADRESFAVPWFSTPERRYPDDEGAPLGVPKSSDDDGVDGPADAVAGLNLSYRRVANLRTDRGDDGDTPETATPVVATSTTFANLTSAADTDYFRVALPEAGWLRVETTGFADTRGALIDEAGDVVAEDDDSGSYTNFLIAVEMEAGVYFVRVNGEQALEYTLVISFNPASAPDDHGDGVAKATVVATPSATAGELQRPSDIDYFRFEVAERGAVRVETTGTTDVLGTLTSADGAIQLTDDDSGLSTNFLISAKLPAGTYFVAVRGFTSDALGAYSLDVSLPLLADDHSDFPSDATDIDLGSSTSSELEVALDIDYYRVAVPAALGPGQLWVESQGGTAVKGALFHESGELIAERDRGARFPNFVVGAHVAPGTYVLRADGAGPSAYGPYELRVSFTRDQPAIPLFLSASHPTRQGFARVINRSARAGEVVIHAIDEAGVRFGPITLSLAAKQTAHFNSGDLKTGNAEKGLSGGVGVGEGDWRLTFDTALDIETLAYVRTDDGALTSIHDVATKGNEEAAELVAIFNPASNTSQVSKLRAINQGPGRDRVSVAGIDDHGVWGGWFSVNLVPGASLTLAAQELETDDGTGKWRLFIHSWYPLRFMNLLESPTGHLTNLTSRPATPTTGEAGEDGEDGDVSLPFFLSASNPDRQSFARIISRGGGDVSIHAIDDSGTRLGPVTLSVDTEQARHFNSRDLEMGNAAKGLSGGVGTGEGDWRLVFDTDLDIEALAYVRTAKGFLTSMNTVAPRADGRLEVVFFNPASNDNQVSRLRLVNPADAPATISITGIDDAGAAPPQGAVTLTLPAGAATSITAQQLEAGADHFTGRFGDGEGKWQLFIDADQDVQAMSLLDSRSTGHITNLSSGTAAR